MDFAANAKKNLKIYNTIGISSLIKKE